MQEAVPGSAQPLRDPRGARQTARWGAALLPSCSPVAVEGARITSERVTWVAAHGRAGNVVSIRREAPVLSVRREAFGCGITALESSWAS